MPTQSIIDSGQCSVITNNSYDTRGSLTRTQLKAATPTEVLAWYYNSSDSTWNPLKTWLAHQFEMQMCGIRRMGFWDWIMSGMKDRSALWKPRSVARGPGLIEPFILGLQDSVLNDESWTISAGWRCAGSGNSPFSDTGTTYTASSTGPLDGSPAINTGDRVIRVSPKYTLSVSADYFPVGYKIVIQSLTSGGTTQTTVYRILDTAPEAVTTPTYVDLLLKAETDNNAAAWFNAAPTSGVVRLLPPNVMDVEAYCRNRINVNTKKEVPFWVQTTRQARRVSSEYEKVRAQLLRDNGWYAKFVDLDEAERNRQDEVKYRREMVNALLFQEPISSNQTLALWKNLEQVTSINSGITVDPGTGGQLMAYRANLVGVLPQLRACGQALDYQNTALNPRTWVETYIYPLYRARKSANRPVDSIDVYTDSDTAAQAETAFIDWYKDRYGADAQIQIDAKITTGAMEEFGFYWRSFKVPTKPAGVVINFIVNEAFDDLKDALGSTYEQAGRYLWTVDFGGSVYPAMVASNHKVHTVGELSDLSKIDATFACVMENPTERVSMNSTTLTMIVECPLQSRVDYGFSQISYTP